MLIKLRLLLILLFISTVPLFARIRIDSTFGTNGILVYSTSEFYSPRIFGLWVQQNGRFVVQSSTVSYQRYLTDGTIDSTFGKNGYVEARFGEKYDIMTFGSLMQSDDKLINLASIYHNDTSAISIERLNLNGSRDISYDNTKFDIEIMNNRYSYVLNDHDIDKEDNLYVANRVYYQGGFKYSKIYYVSSDGLSKKELINTSKGFDSLVHTNCKVSKDQGLYVSFGGCVSNYQDSCICFIKLNKSQALDDSFGNMGILKRAYNSLPFNFVVYKLVVDNKNRLICMGRVASGQSKDHIYLCRITPDGMFDPSFGSDGFYVTDYTDPIESYLSFLVDKYDRLYLTGSINFYGNERIFIERINENGTKDISLGNSGRQMNFFSNYGATGGFATFQGGDTLVLNGVIFRKDNQNDYSFIRYLIDDPVGVNDNLNESIEKRILLSTMDNTIVVSILDNLNLVNCKIFNLQGITQHEINSIPSSQLTLDISAYPAGIYFAVFEYADGSRQVEKFVKVGE